MPRQFTDKQQNHIHSDVISQIISQRYATPEYSQKPNMISRQNETNTHATTHLISVNSLFTLAKDISN